jgi:hypothetical protein
MDNAKQWPTLKGSWQRRLAEVDLTLLRIAFRSLRVDDGAEEEAKLRAREWLLTCRRDGLHVLRAVVWKVGREADRFPVRWRAVLVRELEWMKAEEESGWRERWPTLPTLRRRLNAERAYVSLLRRVEWVRGARGKSRAESPGGQIAPNARRWVEEDCGFDPEVLGAVADKISRDADASGEPDIRDWHREIVEAAESSPWVTSTAVRAKKKAAQTTKKAADDLIFMLVSVPAAHRYLRGE